MSVLLPAPFSPRSACTAPRSIRRLMRSLAVSGPNVLVMPSISSIRRGSKPRAGPDLRSRAGPLCRSLLLQLSLQHELLRLGDFLLYLLRHHVAELPVPRGLLVLHAEDVELPLELAVSQELRGLKHADLDVLEGAGQDGLRRHR